jgi:hypothetical protein
MELRQLRRHAVHMQHHGPAVIVVQQTGGLSPQILHSKTNSKPGKINVFLQKNPLELFESTSHLWPLEKLYSYVPRSLNLLQIDPLLLEIL